ncbi:hypothetical protein [Endozoicomonas numazuensis]|uniref:Uncharacterized protein n=1 Tax=Endozoicomonas numazuensis TaxID=1137799 RepID=A0A081NJS9_9GAMM|nr:hypothetical protein [Endozoicomonas numazuensis]KEQ18702.1 hypothetical protein GZ78_00870 [Endozoicomonas numazuensis]
MTKHIWIEKDDLKIMFVYKFGFDHSPMNKQEIADTIGVSMGSMNYRIGNFKAIEGEGKATNYAKLSLKIFNQYSHLSMQELKDIAF